MNGMKDGPILLAKKVATSRKEFQALSIKGDFSVYIEGTDVSCIM